jgi:hypothetical protein
MQWISLLAADLLASQEGLCSMGLVSCIYLQTYSHYPYVNQSKAHVSNEIQDVLITNNILVNIWFMLLEGNLGEYARGESVVVRQKCEWH